MERKLASIQVVNAVEPIPDADAIERIRVLGWWVVVKKGEFKVGDAIVYAEVDSLLPERPEFEFLRPSSFKPAIIEGGQTIRPAGFRVRTIKLRGQVSQGICFPLSILPRTTVVEGSDVTDVLGVIKYEQPLSADLAGKVKGPFPGFISKTDETRIQAVPELLDQHRGIEVYATEKLDGTSCTYFLNDGEFGVCSRNLWLDETDHSATMAKYAADHNLAAALRQWPHGNVAVQGELIGPGIQKNKYGLKDHWFRVFTVFDIDRHERVQDGIAREWLESVGMSAVPLVATFTLNHTVEQLVEIAGGDSVLVRQHIHNMRQPGHRENPQPQWKTNVPIREGIVIRPVTPVYSSTLGGSLSFKVINPKFLLKHED